MRDPGYVIRRAHDQAFISRVVGDFMPGPATDILMAGYASFYGAAVLYQRNRQVLEGHFSRDFLRPVRDFLEENPSCDLSYDRDFCAERLREVTGDTSLLICPLGEGGIFTALWDLGSYSGLGLNVYAEDILIRQESVEICDFLGINPYLIDDGACTLIAADKSGPLLERLRSARIPASRIGYFTPGRDKVVYFGQERRHLEPFRG